MARVSAPKNTAVKVACREGVRKAVLCVNSVGAVKSYAAELVEETIRVGVGALVGALVGEAVGAGVGAGVGTLVGVGVGAGVGAGVGKLVGAGVGDGVGRGTQAVWPIAPAV